MSESLEDFQSMPFNAIHPLFQGGERPKKKHHMTSPSTSRSHPIRSLSCQIRSDPIPGFRVQRGAKSSKSSRPFSAEKKRPETLLEVAAVAMFDRRFLVCLVGYNVLHGAVALEVYNF